VAVLTRPPQLRHRRTGFLVRYERLPGVEDQLIPAEEGEQAVLERGRDVAVNAELADALLLQGAKHIIGDLEVSITSIRYAALPPLRIYRSFGT
jgi:hypothetical protein